MPFGPVQITNAGFNAINVAVATGGSLNFYEITGGSGFPAPGDVPAQFTQLKSPVIPANPTSVNDAVLYQTTFKANFSSADAPFTFQLNEMGVWYTLAGGSPFLFGYLTTGAANGDTITPSSEFAAVVKDYIVPVVYAQNVPVGTVVTLTPSVELHGPRHLSTGVDPIPNASSTVNGLTPVTPGDNTKVLRGGTAANWGTLPPHAPTHLDNGSDVIPIATTARTGLLPKLSGDPNTVLNGVGNWGGGRIPGEIIDFAGAVPPAGWLICDGQSYPTATYPNLFSVIGYSYGGSGAVFAVPDCRARVTVGAGVSPGLTNRSLTTKGGEETHILSPAEMPVHSHGVNDPTHAHAVFDPQHAHALADPGHVHGVADPGHAHAVFDPGHRHICFFSTNSDSGLPQPGRDSIPPYGYASAQNDYAVQYGHSNIWLLNAYTSTEACGLGIYGSGTGISIGRSGTGMGVYAAPTGIGIYGAATGITIQNTGGNAAHNNIQPYIALNKLIHV
jgi:microcystin-dependent protein